MKAKISTLYGLFFVVLAGCSSLDRNSYQPPKYIFEAWEKQSASVIEVKDAMRSCGYRDLALANDLSKEAAARSEECMSQKGFRLNLSSYRLGNCYGTNSPYLCNRLWGGEKPGLQPVRKY
jgi:hypothetical protein